MEHQNQNQNAAADHAQVEAQLLAAFHKLSARQQRDVMALVLLLAAGAA